MVQRAQSQFDTGGAFCAGNRYAPAAGASSSPCHPPHGAFRL